jgi:hypothetical protein
VGVLLSALFVALWPAPSVDGTEHLSLPPHAILAKVKVGGKPFKLSVARGYRGPKGRRFPCFGLLPQTGPVIDAPGIGCGLPIYMGPQTLSKKQQVRQRAVLFVAFADPVRSVKLDLGKRGTRVRQLQLLSKRLAQKARVKRFHYSVIRLPGAFCLHGVTGYDEQGLPVYLALNHHERCYPDTYGVPQPNGGAGA